MKFHTSRKEIIDIIKAYLGLTIAFTIVLRFVLSLKQAILVSEIAFGLSFLIHELAHKLMAITYNCKAEFRSFDIMLLFAILMSFFGFVFAAPGAVFILGKVRKSQYGKIALAGPLANIGLALISFTLLMFIPLKLFFYVYLINTWLALFNLLPFRIFDGYKIRIWNKSLHTFLLILTIILFILIPYLKPFHPLS